MTYKQTKREPSIDSSNTCVRVATSNLPFFGLTSPTVMIGALASKVWAPACFSKGHKKSFLSQVTHTKDAGARMPIKLYCDTFAISSRIIGGSGKDL